MPAGTDPVSIVLGTSNWTANDDGTELQNWDLSSHLSPGRTAYTAKLILRPKTTPRASADVLQALQSHWKCLQASIVRGGADGKRKRGPLSCLEGDMMLSGVCVWGVGAWPWRAGPPLCSQLCDHASFPFYVLEFEGISSTIQNAPGGGHAVGGVWGHL